MAKEENKEGVIGNNGLTTITFRVSSDVKQAISELYQTNEFSTQGSMISELIGNYYLPKIADKKNIDRISQLEQELSTERENSKALLERCSELEGELQTAQTDKEATQRNYEDFQSKVSSFEQKIKNDCVLVEMNELDKLILDYVCQRENKRRDRDDITPSVLFAFLFESIFIKGDKFEFDSVSNRTIKQIKEKYDQ